MTTEINVINDNRYTQLDLLSRNERELFFDRLKQENPDVPMVIMNSFEQLEEKLIFDSVKYIPPSMSDLLLRKIVQLANFGNDLNTIVVPITTSHVATKKLAVKGGASPLNVSFEKRVYLLTENGLEYVMPPGKTVNVIGIIFNEICSDMMARGKPLTQLSIRYPVYEINGTYEDAMSVCGRGPIRKYNGGTNNGSTDMSNESMLSILKYIMNVNLFCQSEPAAILWREQTKLLPPVTVAPFMPTAHSVVFASDDISQLFESLLHARYIGGSGLIVDVMLHNLSSIYYGSIIHGIKSDWVHAQIKKVTQLKNKLMLERRYQVEASDERYVINTYKLIIEKKFGQARIKSINAAIKLRPQLVMKSKDILQLLSKDEQRAVELEYTKRVGFLEAVINNKCPHVRLYTRFRLTKLEKRKAVIFKDLSKFFAASDDTGMITCSECKFPIICPHVRDMLGNVPFMEMRSKLLKYISNKSGYGSKFCKICGETIISGHDNIEFIEDERKYQDEELGNFIWKEMASTLRHLKFGSLINTKTLLDNMRNRCYNYIYDVEKQLMKSKTITHVEINAKKQLYTAIYAYAYLINLLAIDQKKNIEFKDFVPKSKNLVVDMIQHVIGLVMNTKNVAIREISGITRDNIKNMLIDAYKTIQLEPMKIVVNDANESILVNLLLDPVYWYYYKINAVDEAIRKGRLPKNDRYNLVDAVDDVMGQSIKKISGDIYKHVKIPKFGPEWKINGAPKETAVLDPKVFHTAYTWYVSQSFKLFDERNKLRIYDESMYIDVSIKRKTAEENLSNILISEESDKYVEVSLRAPYVKYNEAAEKLLDSERILYKFKKMEYVHGYYFLPVSNIHQWKNMQTSIGRIYDENGHPHIWDTYVVDGKLMTLKDIIAATNAGTYKGIVSDKSCSVCKVLLSKSSGLDEKKIKSSLDDLVQIHNFFKYFENRCPVGGLHEFVDNICSKCGFKHYMPDNERMEYYRKYKYSLKKEAPVPEISAQKVAPDQNFPDIDTFLYNYNVILVLSDRIKINYHYLETLGATEKQEWKNVASGEYIPFDATTKYSTRIYVIDSYIKNLLTEYNQLRFYTHVRNPLHAHVDLINSSGINKYKLSELSTKMPEVVNDYNHRFSYAQEKLSPENIVLFCIQNFCEICLRILNIDDNDTNKLRFDFTLYYLNKIIQSEELVSKPGHFNWSALYGDKKSDTVDPNYVTSFVSHTDNTDDETTDKPFSLDSYDMENEPGEDEGVEIKDSYVDN